MGSVSVMTHLHSPITIRNVTFNNRIWLAPMCQYHCLNHDGMPEAWHQAHYGARAIGGFGLVTVEATGIVPEGRISPKCTGIWNEEQQEAWKPIVDFAHSQGSKIAMQLIHAGRKSSSVPKRPGEKKYDTSTVPESEGGWTPVGPSAVANDRHAVPRELTREEIHDIPELFAAAASRAVAAGFDAIELSAGHGYLLHQFLSPLSNHREDSWGGSFENRTRLLRLVVNAVRTAIGEDVPLIVRISATDWYDDVDSWDLEQSVGLAPLLKMAGADMISVSSGGVNSPRIAVGPNYQVGFAEEIKKRSDMLVATAGLITEPAQAEAILAEGRADVVLLGREALRNPNWPLYAAHKLGMDRNEIAYPGSYLRGAW